MTDSVFGRLRARPRIALCLGAMACVAAQSASAADCPGRPDAIGTSRTIVVDPREYPIIGTMQYGKTLPLEDHEVVLTFDDGPLPKYSYQILNILAAHCARATFFLVGRQANGNPEGVRKIRDAGHTIATHSQNHPGGMQHLPLVRAQQEIEQGIASISAALADGTAPAPFFRIPGLSRNDGIEAYAASRGLQIWSADFPADDWRPVSAARVYDLAVQRLEAKGKGVLLLHDIQPRTVAALPRILSELKARGYRIVHVVPATPEQPATPTEPRQWLMHPASETVAISRWPRIPRYAYAAPMLLAPGLSDLDWINADPNAGAPQRGRNSPLLRQALWPQPITLPPDASRIALAAPAASLFQVPESTRVAMLAKASFARRTDTIAKAPRTAEVSAAPVPAQAGKSRRGSRTAAVKPPITAIPVTHPPHSAGAPAPKPAEHARKNARSVRVAGLKKR
jgi:peptidoglycan-N-acetylglucosamine deacetylase